MAFGKKKGEVEPSAPPLHEREEGNPYLSARKEYEDRYGSAIKSAARWRQISILITFLCMFFGAAMVWLAAQNKVVPYIVQVDEHGYAVTIKSAAEGAAADQRVIIATLGRILMDLRTVVSDSAAQKRLIDGVYACVARDSSTEGTISTFYRENNPYVLVKEKKQARIVNIRSVVPYESGGRKGTSWLVLWTEETTAGGRVVAKTDWRAIVQIVISPVRELREVLRNPLGIYITDLSIAKDLI